MQAKPEIALKQAVELERELDKLELKYFFSDLHGHDLNDNSVVFGGIRQAIEELKKFQSELHKLTIN